MFVVVTCSSLEVDPDGVTGLPAEHVLFMLTEMCFSEYFEFPMAAGSIEVILGALCYPSIAPLAIHLTRSSSPSSHIGGP
jgi:hypothetical protein